MHIGRMAEKIKEHFGRVPTKEELKKYVVEKFPDNRYSTVELLEALNNIKPKIVKTVIVKKKRRTKALDPNKVPDELTKTILELYKTHTAKEIGDMVGMKESQVKYRIKYYSLGKESKFTEEKLKELYQSHSIAEIANIYEVAPQTIRYHLQKYDVLKTRVERLLNGG